MFFFLPYCILLSWASPGNERQISWLPSETKAHNNDPKRKQEIWTRLQKKWDCLMSPYNFWVRTIKMIKYNVCDNLLMLVAISSTLWLERWRLTHCLAVCFAGWVAWNKFQLQKCLSFLLFVLPPPFLCAKNPGDTTPPSHHHTPWQRCGEW